MVHGVLGHSKPERRGAPVLGVVPPVVAVQCTSKLNMQIHIVSLQTVGFFSQQC